MLYVFHVDAGQMTTYDMSLTLQSVSSLRAAIERKSKIPASSLVLLVSGGEVLQSDHMVSSYSAGTDTNPIYMFSKPSVKESHFKQSMCSDLSPIVELSTGEFRSDTRSAFDGKSLSELKAAVEMCRAMQPTIHTVITCANLAQQFSDLAHEVTRSCEMLVHEQHLQHQGWAAVVANLEDIFTEFCERSKNFKESFRKHRLKKEEYHEQLNTLNEVLESLGKIPILPALQINAEAHRFSAFDVFEESELEAHHYHTSQPLDNSGEKIAQDFGVEVFKLSEEDVFLQKDQQAGAEAIPTSTDKQLEESDEGVTFKAQSYEKDEPTLLHWILAQGNKASLQDILDYCHKGLALIDAEPLKEHEAELCHILEYANMRGLKQIKGIEERLYGLEQLHADVKKLEKDQHDQAASLIQYRDRLNTACDPSVLPTLVQSHWCQLEKLLKGHQTLVDIRRRIAKSKDELSHILKARLETVLVIENSMSVQDAHAMLSYQCFSRLARYLHIVQQLHDAPQLFLRALHEATRRASFSKAHLQWATDLASKLLKIHEEEISRRQEFNSIFEGHFLKSLFPGMTELPPPFATQAPPIYDARLPDIKETDVQFVINSFPQLSEGIPKYDMQATLAFFEQRLSDSKTERRDNETQAERSLVKSQGNMAEPEVTIAKETTDVSTTCIAETMAVSTVTEVRNNINIEYKNNIQHAFTVDDENCYTIDENCHTIDENCHTIDENCHTTDVLEIPGNKNMESKSIDGFDNCDFNDVSVIPDNPGKGVGSRDEFMESEFYIEESMPTSLEWGREFGQDNMDTHKINILRLQDFLLKLCGLCRASLIFIREEIDTIKKQVNEQQSLVKEQYETLLQMWKQSNEDTELRFREATQRLTVDHELELSDMKAALSQKDEVIASLKKEKEDLIQERQKEREQLEKEHRCTKDLLEKTKEDIAGFDKKLEELEMQKQNEIKELQEKMHLDYKAEIESLRARFRLVALTNMDRSPSESSLEKIERTDVIEISSHNAIIMQTKENAEVEKEEAIKQAVSEIKQKCDAEIAAIKAKYEIDKQAPINEATRRLLSEKDKQIELLREREQILMKESNKYRDTIQQLTDPETNDYDSLLKTQMATLENEKALLQQQVQDLKKELDKKSEESTTDKSSKEEDSEGNSRSSKVRVGCHSPLGLSAGTLSLSSCLAGHHVLLLWEPAHHNYIVLQEGPIMFFVHADCLPALDLSLNVKNEADRKLYAIATVESKEFCYAKKNGNRYMMPRSSRFYRVRVKPYKYLPPPTCCDNKHKHEKNRVLRCSPATKNIKDLPPRPPSTPAGPPPLSVLAEKRPLKKWLTYMHAPDIQKSSVSHSTISTTEESSRMELSTQEVATATLINLESPVSTSEAASSTSAPPPSEDQLDSIESSDLWHNAKMQLSTMSTATDMECSVGRVLGAELELPLSEVAEEAAP